MIYLSAEVVSGLGEDTFWTWFKREFPTSNYGYPTDGNKTDGVLRYSTLGPIPNKNLTTIALCWELLPEMKVKLNSNVWDTKINTTYLTASQSDYRVVASHLSIPYYQHCGNVDIIPIGVDTDLFKPAEDKTALRKKYNLPLDKEIIFWGGTSHPMKGFQNLLEFKKSNENYHYICVWKTPGEASHLEGHSNYTFIKQDVMAELMAASDYLLCCGMLQPFYMIEWEAMSCGLKPIILNDMKKDFVPSNDPRGDIFKLGWSRHDVKKTWAKYLTERGVVI